MEIGRFERCGDARWRLPPTGAMRVPGLLFASRRLLAAMDDHVAVQLAHVAALPGIVEAAFAMADAHWGYGFPIGGVAAFDPQAGGVVSAGGVGFDISCGVRTLLTHLPVAALLRRQEAVAEALFATIPAGVGSRGPLHLDDREMAAMLTGGARWAVDRGFGEAADLARVEEGGRLAGADPAAVSERAKARQRDEMGTLGSGNHYLEVQAIERLFDGQAAAAFGLVEGEAVVSIHCGSRGLGHQVCTDYQRQMVAAAGRFHLALPDRDLAAAPLTSPLGQAYLAAMAVGVNCALANRQILTHLARSAFGRLFPGVRLELLYDVSHNTCKEEVHAIGGGWRPLFVHRKGATRAFGPGHPELEPGLRPAGQPVLIGGTMGSGSYILAGNGGEADHAFASACHGAGRAMSRTRARRRWRGRAVVRDLAAAGVLVRSPSFRGVAEEAPGAYKDVDQVAEATERAGLARRVARLRPLVCIKG